MAFPRPDVLTTIHPFQAILQTVVGSRGTVEKLLRSGASPHAFELLPSDIVKAGGAKSLIYGSRSLDGWAIKLEHPNAIALLDMLPGDSLLSIKDHENRVRGVDPHFWTDPLAVRSILHPLIVLLAEIDSDGLPVYRSNAELFADDLYSLYREINQKLTPVKKKPIMLSHPFFQYYTNRFKLNLRGIIQIDPDIEPTAKSVKHTIESARKEQVEAIFLLSFHENRAARLVAEACGIDVFELDPLGGIPGRMTYEEILNYNTDVIIRALQ